MTIHIVRQEHLAEMYSINKTHVCNPRVIGTTLSADLRVEHAKKGTQEALVLQNTF